ncbi:hypothetical protein J2Y00_005092 [Deinococcus soli (ex Cha et al. 2016)]|uniref:Uncharacterized protein n=2 Tax=Deinococcus soli (ex Cha et al. 2016) TaxID=1309411 RepID=A0ACC6KPZ3_9DEIO|nr:hypothetical protein [Deinococcus soli (ex Cha et al. 2016)]MDR6331446.1 hypothetical protein [Deinococcus soli (ex Cha et al. 2016)]MDR6754603.1 hypothetical protein [Deinococcus soli (ex Cha et al. 2016)]
MMERFRQLSEQHLNQACLLQCQQLCLQDLIQVSHRKAP